MKKKMPLITMTLVLTIAAAGCSSGSPNQNGAETASNSAKPASSEPVSIEFAAGKDASGELEKSIARFNSTHDNIKIKYVELPQVPNEQMTRYSTWFNSKSNTPDLFMTDVTWPAMFASAGWLAPIDEYADASYLQRFWPAAVEVGKVNNKQYGIQGYMDVGVLFYRKDLLDKYNLPVPQTWAELTKVSQEILQKENDPKLTGYLFQGAKIEGATINWLEHLWGQNGDIYDQGKVKVDSDKGIQALKTMNNLITQDKVSPVSVSTSNPNDNTIAFSAGNAIFMRNWPAAFTQLKGTKVEGKVGIAAIPHSDGSESHSSTGGWVYAINQFSEHKKEAWEVMKFFLSDEEQKSMGTNASKIPSVRKVFDDPELKKAQPIFEQLPAVMEKAKSRPVLRNYEQISRSVQTQVNLVLSGQKDPEAALRDAQKEIDEKLK
ncbi:MULTISPECIES: ABC transporter substrate-binding protein [Paenibacillus]|nr:MULTISPECIES: ABC transporter substrate-binding protein [Paenibacillus]